MPDTGRNLKREIEKIFLLTDGIDYVHNSGTYMKIYTFASNSANIYKIKKQLLYRFIFYFKEQARELIDDANHSKIFIPQLVDTNITTFKEINTNNFIDSTNIKKFYLNGGYQGIYPTSREVECLKYLVGRSFKEIAEILNISKRTVERHIENIKRKLNVNKQSQLISFYMAELSRADFTA